MNFVRLIVLFAFVALLAACGGGGGGDDGGSNSSGSNSGSSAQLPETFVDITRGAKLTWEAPVTFTNNKNIAPGDIRAYRIHYGLKANNLTKIREVDPAAFPTSFPLSELDLVSMVPGGASLVSFYFSMSAVDKDGISGEMSEVIQYDLNLDAF